MSIEYFGVNSTYSPFSNSMSLRTVTNEKFDIPSDETFLNKPVIGISTGLIPTNSSFLDESFKVVVEEKNGTSPIKLDKVVGKVGNDTYPSEYEVMWFDSENMQSVFWVHEKWHDKILSVTGDFVTTTLTSEVSALYLTGLIMACGFNAVEGLNDLPPNSLICDGSAVSRTRYKKLFSKIGTIWGEGDGVNTFNIPDGRAGVLKGAGTSSKYGTYTQADGTVVDLNEDRGAVGSYQSTAIRNMTGWFDGAGEWNLTSATGTFYRKYKGYLGLRSSDGDNYRVDFNTSRVVPTGQTNRDNNLAINWIIFT